MIGKPSHATGILKGTRMEHNTYGGSCYFCPCGQSFSSLAKIRKHVAGDYKRMEHNCPLGRKGYRQEENTVA